MKPGRRTGATVADEQAHARNAPSNEHGWLTRARVLALFLIVITAGVFYLCYRLTVPFIPALTWALALAVIAYPLHEWLRRRLKNRSLVAALTVVAVTVILVVPVALVVREIMNEALASVEKLQSGVESGRWMNALERNPKFAPALEWIKREVRFGDQVERLSKDMVEATKTFVSGSFYIVTGWLVTLFMLFYFFRDREKILDAAHEYFPLTRLETDKLLQRARQTIYAIVYGTLAVALLQGVLGGLIFWYLEIPAPLMWGAVMAVLAILPVLGAAIVWVPAAAFLALEGNWPHAILLTAWGLLVISLVDNLLYPVLVKDKLRLHAIPVFIAVLGGLAVFGVAGVVLGPVVLAAAVVLLDIWRDRMAHGQAAEDGIEPQSKRSG
jgi:predicted PurR-regulated permease PerM